MVDGFLLVLTILISVTDLRTHKIPNRLNLLLGAILLCDRHSLGAVVVFVAISAALSLTLLLKFGMGDLKLAIVLLVSQSEIIMTSQYLSFVVAMATLTTVLALFGRFARGRSVAFAPVILLPFTAIYLAI